MIKCISCEKEISEEARICPNCGQPQFNVSTIFGSILCFIGILAFGYTINVLFSVNYGFIISLPMALIGTYYGYNKRKTK